LKFLHFQLFSLGEIYTEENQNFLKKLFSFFFCLNSEIMPVTKSAKRQLRKAEKRRERNLYHLTKMKNSIRIFKKKLMEIIQNQAEISDQLKSELESEFRKVVSIISHVASKGVIHKNEARRRISRLHLLFNKALKVGQQKS
jgi:small subunit ribosomal protein S20